MFVIRKPLLSLQNSSDLPSGITGGGFTKGFSVGFDIYQTNRRAFSSGFSFGFARFEFRKAFTIGFSSGFARDDR